MKLSINNTVGALVLALAVTSSALAVPISGSIGFNGTPILDAPLASSTQITGYAGDVSVAGGSLTGSYANPIYGITGATTVTFAAPIIYSPATVPASPLWTFTSGGSTFSFTATSIVSFYNGITNNWSIAGNGTGVVTGANPLDVTPGQYNLTISNVGAAFSFASTTAVQPVPDGGISAILLGFSLVSVGLAARRLKKV